MVPIIFKAYTCFMFFTVLIQLSQVALIPLSSFPFFLQIGGIRFLYDNIIESVSRFSVSPGFGCILAHSMGLGKTLQVSTLLYL